jgi:hypothetical protein
MDPNFKSDLIVAFQQVLHQDPKVTSTEMDDRVGNRTTALLVSGGFTVYPTKTTRRSIRGPVEVVQIAVDLFVPPQTYDDTGDVIELGCFDHPADAIACVISETARIGAQNAVHNEGMARYFQSENEG